MVVVGLWCISKQAPSGSDWPALLTGGVAVTATEPGSWKAWPCKPGGMTSAASPCRQSRIHNPISLLHDSFTLASRAVTDRLHEAQLREQGLLIRWRPPLEWKGDNHRKRLGICLLVR